MKSTISSGIVCFLFFSLASFGQQPPPDQQQPAPVPATPAQPKPNVQLPPPVPKQTPTPPQERDTGGDAISIAAFYWLTNDQPSMHAGAGNTTRLPGDLVFNGQKHYTLEGIVTIPTGRENSIELTYFRTQGTGNQIIPVERNFFGNNFAAGDQVFTTFTVQSAKLSWNYLTWPYPSNGAKFRVKTLWELQYDSISTSFNAPADVDAAPTYGTKSVILPTLGVGIEYHPAKHLRLEVKGSGFGIPHHAVIWDAQASAVLRFGRIEIFASEKAYHFKTSPQGDYYFSETLIGPLGGIRYMFK